MRAYQTEIIYNWFCTLLETSEAVLCIGTARKGQYFVITASNERRFTRVRLVSDRKHQSSATFMLRRNAIF